MSSDKSFRPCLGCGESLWLREGQKCYYCREGIKVSSYIPTTPVDSTKAICNRCKLPCEHCKLKAKL